MSKSNRCKNVGITLGDPGGIGPEIVAKALKTLPKNDSYQFTIIGDQAIFDRYFSEITDFHFIDCQNPIAENYKLGASSLEYGKATLSYLNKALSMIKEQTLDALVTAPLCKESINAFLPDFQGHTEYLADHCNINHGDVGMMFVSPKMRTIIVTRHIPVQKISEQLTQELILKTIKLTHTALTELYKIKNPHIGICGLNPHAGENGIIGDEEILVIIPAIKQAQQLGINISGPFAADTLFSPDIGQTYDTIIAMYHDQGLIPIKTLCMNELVNLTIGLPFIRTSPAHGTAFNIAGQNKAHEHSMKEAISLATELTL